MKLFKNKVGRPSNDVLRKRKMFYLGGTAGVFLILLMVVLSLSNLSTLSLSGAAQNFDKGEKINISSKTKVYLTKTSKLSLAKAKGIFYVRDIYEKSNRVKISKKSKGIALGWVDADEIEKIATEIQDPTSSKYEIGDVNRDKKITEADAKLVQEYVAGIKSLTTEQKLLADINKDGKITAADSSLILSIAKERIKISVDFSRTATILGRTSYHRVTLKTDGDTFEVDISKPNVVMISESSANSFTLRAIDSGTSVITVRSVKTGEKVTFNYTVPPYELPSTNRFGANESKLVSKGKKNGIPVYAENTCDSNIVNKYILDIYALKKYAAKPIKGIYIVSSDSIKNAHGSGDLIGGKAIATGDYGVGYGVIDINCKQYDEYKIYHEAAHVIDFRYKSYYNKYVSEDFEQLRAQYNPGYNGTPQYLRAQSYNHYTEFFADAYVMYLGKTNWKTNSQINNKVEEKINEIKKIGW